MAQGCLVLHKVRPNPSARQQGPPVSLLSVSTPMNHACVAYVHLPLPSFALPSLLKPANFHIEKSQRGFALLFSLSQYSSSIPLRQRRSSNCKSPTSSLVKTCLSEAWKMSLPWDCSADSVPASQDALKGAGAVIHD